MATGAILSVPYYLALKAEAFYRASCTSKAVEAISEAQALVETSVSGIDADPALDYPTDSRTILVRLDAGETQLKRLPDRDGGG